MSFPGFVAPGALIAGISGLVSVFLSAPRRNISGIVADVTVEEEGSDELEITEHPVEVGASISDHAYKRPATLLIRAGWSNSSLSAGFDPNYVTDVYNTLLSLQSRGQVFEVTTGKRLYTNMLMKSLRLMTDEKTETSLDVVMEFRQIIIATVSPTAVPPVQHQAAPAQTQPPQNLGSRQLLPSTTTIQ